MQDTLRVAMNLTSKIRTVQSLLLITLVVSCNQITDDQINFSTDVIGRSYKGDCFQESGQNLRIYYDFFEADSELQKSTIPFIDSSCTSVTESVNEDMIIQNYSYTFQPSATDPNSWEANLTEKDLGTQIFTLFTLLNCDSSICIYEGGLTADKDGTTAEKRPSSINLNYQYRYYFSKRSIIHEAHCENLGPDYRWLENNRCYSKNAAQSYCENQKIAGRWDDINCNI